MLTLKMLKDMPPGIVFATGEAEDSPAGINMTHSHKQLRWVAVRGKGMPDWAIYIYWDYETIDYIKVSGDKIHNPNHIKKLVECDE